MTTPNTTYDNANNHHNLQQLPLIAVRDVIIFPQTQVALFIGREQSIKAIELAQKSHEGKLIAVAQKDSLSEQIDIEDLHRYGTLCRIVSTMPHDSDDKCLKVLIEGLERVEIGRIQNANDDTDDSFIAEFTAANVDLNLSQEEADAQKSVLLELFSDYAESTLRNSRELIRVASGFDNLLELIYFVVTRTQLPLDKKQALLESGDAAEYFKVLSEYFTNTKTEHSIESQLQDTVRKQMENNQREYFLNEKMKAIKSELSDLNDGADDDDVELENRLKEADLPDDVRKKAESEFKKLKQMPASSSEASVVRGYVEWILDTPWNKASKVSINLDKAKQTLDKDHYGLDDVKDRILEYLAVQSRVKQLKGPILCLVGPPGVGKTSLGESIARATGRKFVRMALGGVRDEAEIRGHRRTYIGAMPGKIVQSLAKVEVKNPLFLLDEIDKMAQDFRGDPASALLEVLDPSQNKSFNDHYLDLDLDLSQVMFICTANSMNIPPALQDRMEVIRLPG